MRLVSQVGIIPCQKSKIPAMVSAESGHTPLRDRRKTVAYQSAIEKSFVEICNFANEVVDVRWEPFTVQFFDEVARQKRSYTPDYLVEIADRSGCRFTYIVEVKSQEEYNRIWHHDLGGYLARPHIAAMAWCSEQTRHEFVVATDRWIYRNGLSNVRLIASKMDYIHDHGLESILLQEILGGAMTTLESVIDVGLRNEIRRPVTISILLRSCADDLIHFDVTQPFNERTMFHAGPRGRVFRR